MGLEEKSLSTERKGTASFSEFVFSVFILVSTLVFLRGRKNLHSQKPGASSRASSAKVRTWQGGSGPVSFSGAL